MRNLAEETNREYVRVASERASYMSDTKWVRLFCGVVRAGVQIETAEWRILGSDHIFWEAFPGESELLPRRFSDGRFNNLEYRWIDRIFVPATYRPVKNVGYTKTQDIPALDRCLRDIGEFQIDLAADGLIIHAYGPSPSAG
jgi:hypothetical protein